MCHSRVATSASAFALLMRPYIQRYAGLVWILIESTVFVLIKIELK